MRLNISSKTVDRHYEYYDNSYGEGFPAVLASALSVMVVRVSGVMVLVMWVKAVKVSVVRGLTM